MKIAAMTFRDFHIPFFTIYYTSLVCPLLRSVHYLNFPLILQPASTFIFKYITHITITSVKLKNVEMISRENSKLQSNSNFEGSDDLVIIPLMVLNVDP